MKWVPVPYMAWEWRQDTVGFRSSGPLRKDGFVVAEVWVGVHACACVCPCLPACLRVYACV